VLYEFAMTPDLFDASVATATGPAEVVLVQLLRGIADNGLLANLHKGGWLRHISQTRIPSLPPGLKAKIEVCLTVLEDRHRLVRHPKGTNGTPTSDLDWLGLALVSHNRVPLHAIVLSKSLMAGYGKTCEAFVEFFSALDSPQWEKRRHRTLTVTKSPTAYETALAPILRYARALCLVDPFLNSLEPRFFETVKMCSHMMGQRGHERLPGRIDIHAEFHRQKPEGRKPEDYLSAWRTALEPLGGTDRHRFRVFLWGGKPMHDRFILTDQCGISVPGGLDCRPTPSALQTDWSLLDEDARSARWGDYDPPSSPYKLVGQTEIG
jgi:hypothetical protein